MKRVMEVGFTKITELKKQLKKQSVDGYLQPVNDEYMSEYPPASNRRVEWLCGFSGSAGTLVILKDKAALFTDGRYTLQAVGEIDTSVFETHNSGELAPEAWIGRHLVGGSVGYDPKLFTPGVVRRMESALAKKHIALTPVANPVDAIWHDRPAAPSSAVAIHELRYAGETSADKRRRIAAQLEKEGADAAIIAAPDAVCWLLNIRGRDVESTPLVLAPAIIDAGGGVSLFIDPKRCDAPTRAHLGNEVELCPPDTLAQHLASLGAQKKRVLADPAGTPVWFTQMLTASGATIIEGQDPCLLPKAMKNAVELQGIADAHIRDGAAIVKLLHWLEQNASVTEMEISDRLRSFRAPHPLFVEPSFTTIAGSGPNGAIVHYRVTKESNRKLQQGELFLLDSGGQYPDGTTDITRTIAIGTPRPEHKDRFTRVLKGHIALALIRFPQGTCGSQLDVLARQYLWQQGLDYDHGTGHGVGCFLGVHEGPQRISKRGGDAALQPGMILSNEPGYYKTGAYGIRIENLVKVVEKGERFLGFETLTCAPLDTRLIEPELLTAAEKNWLNDYHAWVLRSLGALLAADEKAWLEAACRPVI